MKAGIVGTMRLVRWVATLTTAIFLAANLLTIGMAADHPMDMGCAISTASPMSHGGSLCGMSAGDHLAWWQATFTGVPGGSSLLAFILSLAAISVLGFVSLAASGLTVPRGYLGLGSTDPPDHNLHDYFKRFLAAGIAQPLLYA